MADQKKFMFVGVWFAVSFFVPLLHDGFNAIAVTTLLALAYFLLSLFWFYKKGPSLRSINPGRTFIIGCTVNAMAVEVFHMISKPLHDSLLITRDTSAAQAIKNISIDLVLTFPAYLLIFSVIWYLLRRYRYSPFSYFVLMALGQALGDGQAFFLSNPGALVFIPYVMINYWAMNFVPYLTVRPALEGEPRKGKVMKIILPVIALPLTYFVAAAVILTAGAALGWIPQ